MRRSNGTEFRGGLVVVWRRCARGEKEAKAPVSHLQRAYGR